MKPNLFNEDERWSKEANAIYAKHFPYIKSVFAENTQYKIREVATVLRWILVDIELDTHLASRYGES